MTNPKDANHTIAHSFNKPHTNIVHLCTQNTMGKLYTTQTEHVMTDCGNVKALSTAMKCTEETTSVTLLSNDP